MALQILLREYRESKATIRGDSAAAAGGEHGAGMNGNGDANGSGNGNGYSNDHGNGYEYDGAAGASVDLGADERGTVLCIAHRLETIIFYDKVLVLDGGSVAYEGKYADMDKSLLPIIDKEQQGQGVKEKEKEKEKMGEDEKKKKKEEGHDAGAAHRMARHRRISSSAPHGGRRGGKAACA